MGSRLGAVGRAVAEGLLDLWDMLLPAEAGSDGSVAEARYRCQNELCGCEVVVVRPSAAASWRPPECHGRVMARVGLRD